MKIQIVGGIAVLALFGLLQATAQPQYVTLHCVSNNAVQNFAVQTNQVITLVGYDWLRRPSVAGHFPDGKTTTISPYTYYYNAGPTSSDPPVFGSFSSPFATQIVTGLTNIAVTGTAGGSATFKIETPPTSSYMPANAVVIPTDATGPVEIVLESSADLINWTSALPGTYGTSATNRFFRVRAVASP